MTAPTATTVLDCPAPFIVGTGRSGTTLLRMMLDSHSQLAIPPETEFGPVRAAFLRGGIGAAIEAVVTVPRWDHFNIAADDFISRARRGEPESLGELARILYRLYAEHQGKPRWGDKTPYLAPHIAAISAEIPEARFIHMIRDGRDVALSMAPLWFGPDELADIARWWVETIEVTREQADRVPHYLEVRYESLVRDPPGTLREICNFIELEWEPSMLDYHLAAPRRIAEEAADAQMPSRMVTREDWMEIHRLLASPPRRDRLERWRREMSMADRQRFERIAGDTLEQLGYPVGALR